MEEENNQENKKDKKKNIHAIRTFKTDAAEYMQKGEVSATDLFVKKQKPISYDIEQAPPRIEEKNKKSLIIILAVVAVAALGFSAYIFWGGDEKTTINDVKIIAPKPLLVSEDEFVLEAKSKEGLRGEIERISKEKISPGDLIYLPMKKQIQDVVHFLSASEFLNSLGIAAPAFLTNFLEDDFFLGLLSLQKKHVVLIFELEKDQYDNTFAGMVRWEKTMLRDLDFVANRDNLDDSGKASFRDKIIKNQSARIAETEKGDVLVYTFINRNFIIITDDEGALEEIIRRFILYKFSML